MKNYSFLNFIAFFLFLTFCSCKDPEITASISMDKFTLKLPDYKPTAGCTTPRPANVGCKYMCKPCKFWYCLDGKWVSETIKWGDECKPKPGTPVDGCPRSPEGFCPAECHVCF